MADLPPKGFPDGPTGPKPLTEEEAKLEFAQHWLTKSRAGGEPMADEDTCPRRAHGSHDDPDNSGQCIYCGLVLDGSDEPMVAEMPPFTAEEVADIEDGDQPGRIAGAVTGEARFVPDEPGPISDEELDVFEATTRARKKEKRPGEYGTLALNLRLLAEVRRLRESAKPLEELLAKLEKMATNDLALDCGCWGRIEDALKTYQEATEDVALRATSTAPGRFDPDGVRRAAESFRDLGDALRKIDPKDRDD